MAFGKDPSQLSGMGTFRQTSKQHQQSRPKFGGGGGNIPYFVNQFKPSKDEPDNGRIIKGQYEVEVGQADGSIVKQVLFYFPYIEHYHATMKKGSICSGGPFAAFKDKREPCYGCEVYWEARAAGNKNGPMARSEKYAFSWLHYAPYAKVPQTDRTTGQVRKNDKGEPYTSWQRFYNHQRAEFKDLEQRDWNLMHWSVGFGHYNTLVEYDKEFGRSCANCGTRDSVVLEAWVCRQCGEALIEPSTTTLAPKAIDDLVSDEVRCGGCGYTGMLSEVISCTACASAKRAEIFDVDISVKRIGVADSNQTTLAVTGWSNPRPIDQRLIEVAKPLPLEKIFAPTPYEKQLEIYGATRAPVTSGQHSRPYGGGAPTVGPGGKVGY